jgi:DNA mismatch repair protein MutS
MNEDAKTLVDVIDRTASPMGARMLKRWVALPLKEKLQIRERHDIVQYFLDNPDFKDLLLKHIKQIGDLERIISKVAARRIAPREVVQLKLALASIDPITTACKNTKNEALIKIGDRLNPCSAIKERIEKEIILEPANIIGKGNVIANGVSEELDELRSISNLGKDYLLAMQKREIERTGISSLKINFNNVFGYYIEVRNTHKDKVPEEWIRKQTLVSAERYITQELKDYETKILTAEEKSLSIEAEIFQNLVISLSEYISTIQLNAALIAKLDCLLSFSMLAAEENYNRPEINDSNILDIKQGRHPVIEQQLPIGEPYIANDLYLDNEKQQLMVITGPNMSGKSALLRQTALIVLLAQIGSFVPVDAAKIGIVDKIFTRVGASDNISLGESTFMVEMNEAASILNNISDRSLILLDEIGRGTSTYDGISIAWAMVEYIHEHPLAKAKTLFATHYHELNEMEKSFSRIKNYNVSIKELDNEVIFLRKLKEGGSEHSFGIHVARMAGMPKSVIKRANEVLQDLESSDNKKLLTKSVSDIAEHREGVQTTIFQLDDPVLKQIRDQIKNIDIDNLTPVEALNKLNEIKKFAGV